MRYIHVSVDTLGKLLTDFKNTRLAVYDKTYDSMATAFVGVHLMLKYNEGILLIRAYDNKGSARFPSTFLSVPDYMKTSDVLTHEVSFYDIIHWDIVHAICELRNDFTSYDAALNYGPVKVPDALNDLFGVTVTNPMFYAIVGKATLEDKAAKLYCCVKVDDVNWERPSTSQLVYVPYTTIKNYYRNKQNGFYADVYRCSMDKISPIYSNYDDRIKYPDTIIEGYELYKHNTKFKNVL